MSFKEFQYGCHGGHLGYQNGTTLAILNLYVTPMPPIKFWLSQPKVWEEMSFGEFQDGRHLGYQKGTILAILNLYNAPMPPIKFWLNLIYGLGGDVVWRISRWRLGGYLGYHNVMILAILNLSFLVMLPITFWLNPISNLGGDVVWRISRWLLWRPAWISERNNFSNSKSLCHCDASHQVSPLSCVEVLRPSQPNGVMSRAVSLPNHTFTGQA